MVVRDPSLDTLLLLDDESFVVNADGKCWVKFVVKQVAVSPERPHGLDYSLTLHDEDGSGCLASTTRTPFVKAQGRERAPASSTTTGTPANGPVFIPTPMPQPCSRTSGQR